MSPSNTLISTSSDVPKALTFRLATLCTDLVMDLRIAGAAQPGAVLALF